MRIALIAPLLSGLTLTLISIYFVAHSRIDSVKLYFEPLIRRMVPLGSVKNPIGK